MRDVSHIMRPGGGARDYGDLRGKLRDKYLKLWQDTGMEVEDGKEEEAEEAKEDSGES